MHECVVYVHGRLIDDNEGGKERCGVQSWTKLTG